MSNGASRRSPEAGTPGVRTSVDVVSFDNTLVACQERLSSYDFNCAGALHRVLDTVPGTRGAARRGGREREAVVIEGQMVERESSRWRVPEAPAGTERG